jgi:hypothetical protein
MTDETEKPTTELTTQQRAAIGKTTRNGVSGRLKAALDDMIEKGTPWEQAGTKANLTVRAMRLALKRPAVIRYLRDARRVWLSSATGENLHALARVRDQDENKAAAAQAARSLESLASEQFEPGSIAIQPAGAEGIYARVANQVFHSVEAVEARPHLRTARSIGGARGSQNPEGLPAGPGRENRGRRISAPLRTSLSFIFLFHNPANFFEA